MVRFGLATPLLFSPDPTTYRRVLLRLALGWGAVLAIAYFWELSTVPVAQLVLPGFLGFAAFASPPLILMAIRGLDTVTIDEKGLAVARRKGEFQLAWSDISEVVRSDRRLVFKVGTQGQRHTIYLNAHVHHLGDLLEAVEKRGSIPRGADADVRRTARVERRRG